MWARKILDNDEWLVTVGPLGGVRVADKEAGTTRKASAAQAAFMHRAIRRLKERGVPIVPGNLTFEEVVGRLCTPIAHPNSLAGQFSSYMQCEPEFFVDAILDNAAPSQR